MKTQSWSTRTRVTLGAGATALMICVGKPAEAIPGQQPPPSASVASTAAGAATNTASLSHQPLAKVPPKLPLSPGLAEIVKLAQSGVETDVLLAYVNNSRTAYNPTADELVYLHDVGIPSKVVSAVIERGKKLREPAAQTGPRTVGDEINPPGTVAAPSPLGAAAPPPAGIAPYTPGYPAESPSYSVPAPAPAPDAASLPPQVNQFYDTLSPYGTWYDLPDYGWCWQPTAAVVQPGWRPYCNYGRWLDSDCGWYWQSDYSWGWAPFHYGRWCNYGGLGWTWVPGSVWGPSWVCWRQSPLYCGWAPLPPGAVCGFDGGFSYFGAGVGVGFGFGLGFGDFTFLPWGHFCDWNPGGYYLGAGLAANAFNQSTVNNRYFRGPNGRIMNLGADPARVAAATRSEISKVTIRDLTPAAGKVVRPDRLERDGSALVVYRPQTASTRPTTPNGQMTYNRSESSSASAVAAGHTAASATAKPVAAIPQVPGRSAPMTTAATHNLIPLVRLPTEPAGSWPGTVVTPQRGLTPNHATRPVGSRPSANSTPPWTENRAGSAGPIRTAGLSPGRSAADQPLVPFLGRYPTVAPRSVPSESFRGSEATISPRQEVIKSPSGETRYAAPEPWSRPQRIVTTRPAFYNPPSITRPSPAPEPYRGASPATRGSDSSTRGNYYRTEPPPAASSYYARPQAPSANSYRSPSYSAPRSYSRPSYSAPSYSYRPSYTPHYSAPAPAYHSSGGYSGGYGSGGRSSGGSSYSSSSRSNR